MEWLRNRCKNRFNINQWAICVSLSKIPLQQMLIRLLPLISIPSKQEHYTHTHTHVVIDLWLCSSALNILACVKYWILFVRPISGTVSLIESTRPCESVAPWGTSQRINEVLFTSLCYSSWRRFYLFISLLRYHYLQTHTHWPLQDDWYIAGCTNHSDDTLQ